MTNNAQEPTSMDAQFAIQRIYIKNLSYETTNTPAIFQQKWEPELNLELNTQHTQLENHVYEVALTVTATVKNEQAVAFLVEVQQAGIFTIQGPSTEQLDHILNSFCPGLLFPYAREVISSEVMRGSFPQLVLSPINFDALYMQQLQEKQGQETQAAQATEH